jgi:hypothetical protein
MVRRLARFTLPIACACALTGALPAAASAKLAVGISDNGTGMFSSPQFQRLHATTARNMIFWNVAVMKHNTLLIHNLKVWLADAQAAHLTPLISFAGNGNLIPSTKAYTTAIRAFIRIFPQVKLYTPWNEPDWIFRPKLANNPKLAASYFNALSKYCHGCTVAAGDVYRAANQGLGSWVRSYAKWLRPRPKAWAIHPYNDVRTHTTKQLRAFQKVTKGPIWFDEISGVLRRGHWQFKNQSAAAAGRDEKFLFSLPKRFHRIARIYHYQWQGEVDTPNTGWDSGLINPNLTPRPAYQWVLNAAHGKLP